MTNDHAPHLLYTAQSCIHVTFILVLLLVGLVLYLFNAVVLSEDLLHRCDDGGGAYARHHIRPRDQSSPADVRPQGS